MSVGTRVAVATAVVDIPAAEDVKPPWTVLAYFPLSVLWVVAFRSTDGIALPLIPTLVGLALDALLGYGMYRRRKAARLVALVLMILSVLGIPNGFARAGEAGGLLNLAFVIAVLYVLLHPATRAWCSEVRPPMQRPGPSGQYGTERPSPQQFHPGERRG